MIDTSQLRPAQLRGWMRDLVGAGGSRLTLVFESFAFKHGVPLDADYVFDVRVLPNPHYIRELRPLTGRDAAVGAYLGRSPKWSRCWRRSRPSCALAAGVRGRPAQLPHGGDRLHRRPASFGLVRRDAGASASQRARDAGAPSRARRRTVGAHAPRLGHGRAAAVSAADRAVSRRPARAEGLRGALPRPGVAMPARAPPFGVVALRAAAKRAAPPATRSLSSVGTLAELIEVDSAQAGILQVRCRGTRALRGRRDAAAARRLWLADVDPDRGRPSAAPTEPRRRAGLADAIAALEGQGAAAVPRAVSVRRRRLGREPLVRDPADPAGREAEADGARRSARCGWSSSTQMPCAARAS